MSAQTRSRIAALLFVCLANANGCSNAKDEPDYKYPDNATFCSGRAKAECHSTVTSQCATTLEVCIAKAQAECANRIPSAAKYRPQAAEACLATVFAVYSDAKFDAKEVKQVEDVCSLVHGGTGAKGQSCSSNLDCDLDQELRCVIKPGNPAGSCQRPVLVGIGEDCAAPEIGCRDDDNYCETTNNACIKKKDTGAVCGANKLCKDNLRCVKQTPEAAEGTCQAKSISGAECKSKDECADGMCIEVRSATGTTNQCAPLVVLSPSEPSCARYK